MQKAKLLCLSLILAAFPAFSVSPSSGSQTLQNLAGRWKVSVSGFDEASGKVIPAFSGTAEITKTRAGCVENMTFTQGPKLNKSRNTEEHTLSSLEKNRFSMTDASFPGKTLVGTGSGKKFVASGEVPNEFGPGNTGKYDWTVEILSNDHFVQTLRLASQVLKREDLTREK